MDIFDASSATAATYDFDPPIYIPCTGVGPVSIITLVDIEPICEGMYDLFDQDGYCLNEGMPFLFIPSIDEVREWLETGKILGKVE